MATAWVVGASLTINPNIYENAPVAPKAVVLVDPYGTLSSATGSFGSVPASTDLGDVVDLALDAEPLSLAAAAPASDATPPPVAMATASDIAPPPAAAAPASGIALPPKRPPDLATSVPLPPVNPFFRPHIQAKHEIVLSSARQPRQQAAGAQNSAVNSPPRDNRNPFQKLFDALAQPSGPVLADARPEDGRSSSAPTYGNTMSLPAADSRTAIYDIEAHVVYMPNGDRLEAHSGLGNRLDDPSHVAEKDRGATPPHTYDLELRRPLFHGVQALRLNPVDGGNIFGRTGLLAHSYMLGPNGDSNGCVSFKDYPEFLNAFLRGEITRLVVVARLGDAPPRTAFVRRRHVRRYAFNDR
jgi:hypothetical protein